MYLIITVLLLLPIACCNAQEVRELLNGRGYEQGNIRVWFNQNGSIQGCEDVGGSSVIVSRDLYPVLAEQVFKQLKQEYGRQELERHERELARRRVEEMQRGMRRVLRQAREAEDIRVQNATVLGVGCFIIICVCIAILMAKERGPRVTGY